MSLKIFTPGHPTEPTRTSQKAAAEEEAEATAAADMPLPINEVLAQLKKVEGTGKYVALKIRDYGRGKIDLIQLFLTGDMPERFLVAKIVSVTQNTVLNTLEVRFTQDDDRLERLIQFRAKEAGLSTEELREHFANRLGQLLSYSGTPGRIIVGNYAHSVLSIKPLPPSLES
jgi:hypothetical protein